MLNKGAGEQPWGYLGTEVQAAGTAGLKAEAGACSAWLGAGRWKVQSRRDGEAPAHQV